MSMKPRWSDMRGEARLSQDYRKGPVAFPANPNLYYGCYECEQVGKPDHNRGYYYCSHPKKVKGFTPPFRSDGRTYIFDGRGSWWKFEVRFVDLLWAYEIKERDEVNCLSFHLRGSASDLLDKKVELIRKQCSVDINLSQALNV